MGNCYFVRHGESEANRDEWLAGHRDSPLTDRGREQAALARPRLLGLTFQSVLVSDLRRASETAQILVGDRGLTVCTTSGLRERRGGDWEGRPLAVLVAAGHLTRIRGWDVRPPGGESLSDVARRALRVLAEHDAGQDLLVVTHGALMRALLHAWEHGPGGEVSSSRLGNAEVVHYFAAPGRWAELLAACEAYAARQPDSSAVYG
jgi:glucosyl-3-phosphoglycerate phosphatase